LVILRPEITFVSGFPEDAVCDENGFVDVQPGRNVAEALKVALEHLGYRVSTPIDAGDHGWDLDIWRWRQRFSLQIVLVRTDENYLRANLCGLLPHRKFLRMFLSDLQPILEADRRFSRIGWWRNGCAGAANMAPAAGPFDG
jgi:hypothetical protein